MKSVATPLKPVPRVIVVLPGPMIARNWLSTELGRLLGAHKEIAITLLTPDEHDRAAADAAGLEWRQMLRGRTIRGVDRLRYHLAYLVHLMLAHRFNAMAGFRGARERLNQSWSLRKIAFRDGLPASRWFGRPFSRSRRIYRWLDRLYSGRLHRYREVETLFETLTPSLLVLGHIQNHVTVPYALAAAARGIPILGMIGSWDQPTTKGPLNPGVGRILAQSQGVARELERYHAVAPDRIEVVGWVQMDHYKLAPGPLRATLLAELGLPANFRYVLLGAYQERLGRHEPLLCRSIIGQLETSGDCALVIRCHPIDRTWRERLGVLHRPPRVIVVPPELGGLDRLASQIRHAEMVLSSAGSILLDAVALDTPAIAIALEDETEPYYDRVARRYDMEHWAALVGTGGVALARTDQDLAKLITETLADRGRDAAARARLVAEHLAPLDGHAARRIAVAIAAAAQHGARNVQEAVSTA